MSGCTRHTEQVDHLSGHVTRLDADYRTFAATLRTRLELMRQLGRQRAPERDHGPSR